MNMVMNSIDHMGFWNWTMFHGMTCLMLEYKSALWNSLFRERPNTFPGVQSVLYTFERKIQWIYVPLARPHTLSYVTKRATKPHLWFYQHKSKIKNTTTSHRVLGYRRWILGKRNLLRSFLQGQAVPLEATAAFLKALRLLSNVMAWNRGCCLGIRSTYCTRITTPRFFPSRSQLR
jgi:hypothetical protein